MVTKYEHYDDPADQNTEGGGEFGDNWAAQLFTPQETHLLSVVRLYLRTGLGAVGDVIASIRTYPPTGADLITKTINGAGWGAAFGFKVVTFDAPILVIQDVQYAIVERHPGGDAGNYLRFGVDSTDPTYTRGWRLTSANGGLFWTSHLTTDFLFSEWGEAYVVAPTVTTDPATGVGMVLANQNGTLDDDGGEACACGFEWGETVAYGNTTPTQSKNTGETFSQALSGLTPGTTYHFRAFATNASGTSYGADRTFTTYSISAGGGSRGYALGRHEL